MPFTIADVPEGLAAKYFDRNGDGYAFSRALRRSVIFGSSPVSQIRFHRHHMRMRRRSPVPGVNR